MADEKAGSGGVAGHLKSWIKGIIGMALGIGSGVVMMYSNAIVDKVIKPTKPVANFAVTTDGLTVTFQNHATGDSGWWDFGDGTPLEPFDATKETIAHAFPKLGNYNVKLTVRNFLSEENVRQVPVEIVQALQTLPMSITGLKIEALGDRSIAPAGFRISGEVKNAEKVVFDLGGKNLTTDTENGVFEKLWVLDKPGEYPIRIIGITGKTVIKEEAKVTVSAPAVGSVSVVLRVSDSGMTVEKRPFPQTLAIPMSKKGEKTFDKVVNAEPGFTITTATLGKVASPAVKNVKIDVAADKKSAKITGEWTGTPETATKTAGGSDVMIPFTLAQEKTTALELPVQTVSGVFGPDKTLNITLPPQPRSVTGSQRKIRLEVVQTTADGRQQTIHTEPDVKMPWQATASRPNMGYGFGAAINNGTFQARMTQQAAR